MKNIIITLRSVKMFIRLPYGSVCLMYVHLVNLISVCVLKPYWFFVF